MSDSSSKPSLLGKGLRLIFSADISQKYAALFGDNSNMDGLAQDNAWSVLGSKDFLQVDEIESFDDLNEEPDARKNFAAWRLFHDLVLIPFEYNGHSPQNLSGFVDMLKKPLDANGCPFLVVTKIAFSPRIFEFEKGPSGILEAMGHMVRLLTEGQHSNSIETHCFWCLGGADLVLISLPKSVEELWWTHNMTRRARSMMLAELFEGKPWNELKKATKKNWPCHACVSVVPILGFHANSKSYLKETTPSGSKDGKKLKLRYRLRVDCGHEEEVCEAIRGKTSEHACVTGNCWGTYAVEGEFSSFEQLFNVWNNLWFSVDDPTWRAKHLVDHITHLSLTDHCKDDSSPVGQGDSFGDGAENADDAIWVLTDEVKNHLVFIEESITKFGKEFLSEPQLTELTGTFNTFRRCFFQHQLLGTARDILPFFVQMAKVMDDLAVWKDYFSGKKNAVAGEKPEQEKNSEQVEEPERGLRAWNSFEEDMERLLDHLRRAVRNRIEHRSIEADPPVPHTLGHGACKLINAYSVTLWLCSELFRRSPDGENDAKVCGDVDHFAVALSAGTSGRVCCDELFEGFREYATDPYETSDHSPFPRLLLLEISGRSLLRPEMSFAHCLHEIAEVSDWILQPRCTELRKIINDWIVEHISIGFRHSLEEYWLRNKCPKGTSFLSDDLKKQIRLFANTFVGFSAKQYVSNPGLYDYHPVAAVTTVYKAMQECANGCCMMKENPLDQLQELGGYPPPISSAELQQVVYDWPEANYRIKTTREFVTEVTADIGMWAASEHVLSSFGYSTYRSDNARNQDLDFIFESLLAATFESKVGEQLNLGKLVVRRWAIQAMALDPESWEDRLEKAIQGLCSNQPELMRSYLDTLKNAYWDRMGPDYTLGEKLHKLSSYGGGKQVKMFADKEKFSSTERNILKQFAEVWNSVRVTKEGNSNESLKEIENQKRMAFVHSLWATSGTFGVKSMLRNGSWQTNNSLP